jgi:hypothetical protein
LGTSGFWAVVGDGRRSKEGSFERINSVHLQYSKIKVELPRSFSGEWVAAVRRLRNRYARPGRPEGLPRTAAIARKCRQKKTPAIVI